MMSKTYSITVHIRPECFEIQASDYDDVHEMALDHLSKELGITGVAIESVDIEPDPPYLGDDE